MRVLVLGVSGMLGSVVFRVLSARSDLETFGAGRSSAISRYFPSAHGKRIEWGVDAENADALARLLRRIQPSAMINCVGVVKQLASAKDPLISIPINAILPHRLANLCNLSSTRLIHISTDCVFSGRKGNYREEDEPDAQDLYGRSKLLGEVVEEVDAMTLRTSIIGRELTTRNGLIEWFLSQEGEVRGFSRAVFSGLTTYELAKVIADYVLPRPDLHGLYHVSAEPVSKYELLQIVKSVYGCSTRIGEDPSVKVNRSLDSSRFRKVTGYVPPSWPELIRQMHAFEVAIEGHSTNV
jgi:dTDP-4-dehydrorhamnose reductase